MNIAVILSGGIGSRMNSGSLPKQYWEVGGKPVLVWAMENYQRCDAVDRIVVVANDRWHASIELWAQQYGLTKLCAFAQPGPTRQESVYSGLLACQAYMTGNEDYVLIHDAARPLVTPALISHCIECAKQHDGCLPVISIKDSVYCSTNGTGITALADRSTLYCGQCPEVLRLQPYLELHKHTPTDVLQQIRGSCELAFQAGMDICITTGDENNFKLTTETDMQRFINLLDQANTP